MKGEFWPVSCIDTWQEGYCEKSVSHNYRLPGWDSTPDHLDLFSTHSDRPSTDRQLNWLSIQDLSFRVCCFVSHRRWVNRSWADWKEDSSSFKQTLRSPFHPPTPGLSPAKRLARETSFQAFWAPESASYCCSLIYASPFNRQLDMSEYLTN